MGINDFMIIEEKGTGGAVRFVLKGRVDASSAIRERLEKSLQSGRMNIVVNMCQVEYLSSAGIRVLLGMYKKAKVSGGKLSVENPSENVINVLGLTALDEMLLK